MSNSVRTKKEVVKIVRPPLSRTFDVPTPDELLKVFQGDSVKLIFQSGEHVERMWVTIIRAGNMDEWEAVLDHDPVTEEIADEFSKGDVVHFHPYDVIDIDLHERDDQNETNQKDQKRNIEILPNKIVRPWYKNSQIIVTIAVGVMGAIATIIAALL